MAVKVIDASALGALLFGEPDADKVLARIDSHRLVAPALLPFELASVCLKKVRLHPERRDPLLSALRLMGQLDIDYVEIPLPEVVLLAEKASLTTYDAAYLWLAQEIKAELVTLDKRLIGAFSS
jgi:predicted nucleic acid-binding protein